MMLKGKECLFIIEKNNDSWRFAVIADSEETAVEKLSKIFPKEDFVRDWSFTESFRDIIC